ncbi:DUF6318 family protein [Brachybacterium timonense]|uniref:DUF6318 family protein n=1 Tax=Brachybacterium timonense TaxID=2050896 RepID=UPI000D0B2EA6|nr:DUF6318 family protein [Brachybacterium timonense]
MQRRTVSATPHHAKHSDHAALSPEAMLAGPAGAPPGAGHSASTGLMPSATPARSGRQRRGARVLAASAALMLALSACGGDEPPDNGLDGTMPDLSTNSDNGGASDNGGTDNTAASDAGGDSGSDDLAASIPAPDPADYPGMDQNTPEGAEQAFKYYIAVLTWAHQTGDTELLSTLHSDDCSNCKGFESRIETLRDSDSLWVSATVTPGHSEVMDAENFDHEVGYIYTIDRSFRNNSIDAQSDEPEVVEVSTVGGLTWVDNSWIVGGYSSDPREVSAS